jgi:hypothetical protein
MLNQRKRDGYFAIPLWVHRNDIDAMGFDVSQLKDGDLEYIAQRIADDYLRKTFPEALRETVEYYMQHGKKSDNNQNNE